MRQALLSVVLFCCLALFASAQEQAAPEEEKKERKLIESLSVDSLNLAIQTHDAQVQEEISVEAEEYPGLNIDVQSPAASLSNYKPFTKQELQAYSDLLTDFSLLDYDRSETARPQKPARLFRTTIPD